VAGYVGVTGSPDESGARRREKGLARAGNARARRDLIQLAYRFLVFQKDGAPLWSSEHLTRERVEEAHTQRRVNEFHPDPNLPPDERAELSDYARSGFNRRHMAPSGDMPDPRSQEESFSLANMVPQNPDSNRHLWERIETAVRDLARRDGELYVVTGPIIPHEALRGRRRLRRNDLLGIDPYHLYSL
jgi:endonuclease G, mitochondrial